MIESHYFVGRHDLDAMMRKAKDDGVIVEWDDCRGDGLWFDARDSEGVASLKKEIVSAGLQPCDYDNFIDELRKVADG